MFLRISQKSSKLSYNGKQSLKLIQSASKGFILENSELENYSNNNSNQPFTYKRFNSTASTKSTATQQRDDLDKLSKSFKNNKKKLYNNSTLRNTLETSSPWYNQLRAFDDCVMQSLSVSRANYKTDNYRNNETLMFWDSLARAMTLYNDLLECPELNATRIGSLINLLHNGLRINRGQLIALNKKPDFDSRSFNMEISKNITEYLRDISRNLLDGKIVCNEYGVMHLLTSFKELNKIEEAINIWKDGMKNDQLIDSFVHPKVVGVMLPLLYETESFTFEQCKQLYETSRKRIEFNHPNLNCGFIVTCLMANENMLALESYSTFCDNCRLDHFKYLAEAHLAFIGKCKDIDIAESFLDRAIKGDMPYKVNLNVSEVNSLLGNTWSQLNDFQRVKKTWLTALNFYKNNPVYKNRRITGILSSLNNVYFEIFFQNYQKEPLEGFKNLQESMNSYMEIVGKLDEPLLNIILAKSAAWQNQEIIDSILKNFELNNLPQTIITKRILLKILGSIDNATPQDIIARWNQLIGKGDQMGQSFIANADWAALRDATLTWAQNNKGSIGAPLRVELYFKLVKLYKPYCRDIRQVKRITDGLAHQLPVAQRYLDDHKIQDIVVDDIPILQDLQSLEINEKLA